MLLQAKMRIENLMLSIYYVLITSWKSGLLDLRLYILANKIEQCFYVRIDLMYLLTK